ncbi:MAG: hypothetical protein KDB75_10870, partial [Flavobacteriales bacterium]|nr:hypothetical protein [Flavobacteriales bacterium]
MRRILSTLALSALFLLAGPVVAGGGEPAKATVSVEAAPGSAFLKLNIRNHRKIGKVAILVRDAKGRVIYSEEGKAMTGELVIEMGDFGRCLGLAQAAGFDGPYSLIFDGTGNEWANVALL